MKQVRIVIKGGMRVIEAMGYTGPACEAVVRDMVRKLGGEIVEAANTPDYYKAPEQVEENQ